MANTVPYIGSRMSLISKAEIRYEGFLHEIDTQNTTVTLKNVRSFGTENRRTDKVIPPKDDVFQYIIFRGSDIKDISVCEAAPFMDPAILQSGPPASGAGGPRTLQTQSTSQSAPGAPSALTPDAVSPTPASFAAFGMPTGTSQAKPYPPTVPSPQTMFPQTSSAVQEAPQLSPEPHLESRQSNVDHNTGRPSNNQGRQNYNQKGRGFLNDRGDRSYSATARQNNQYNRNNYQQDYARPYSYNTSASPYTSYSSGPGFRSNNGGGGSQMSGQGSNWQNRNYSNYQNNWRNSGQNRRGGLGGNGPRGQNRFDPSTGADLQAIEKDFDFKAAHEKFDKSQLVKEFAAEDGGGEEAVHNLEDVEDGEVLADGVDATKFYDKSKSFFDSISCDALEKKNSRLTTAEEKKLNAQTFGVPTVIRNRNSGGGGPGNSGLGGGYGRPRYGNNDHHSGGGGGGNNFRNREYSSNFYGGFGNTGGGGGGNFSRRGPGASNSYYTPNYSGGAERGAHLGGGRDQGGPRQNYRQNNNSNSGPGNRISQPAQA